MAVVHMEKHDLIITDSIDLADYKDALRHIGTTLATKGFVKESHTEALLEREESFPTGIALDGYAVAIPHCDASHAIKPVLYIIKPNKPVTFNRPDEDETIDVSLIIGLVVTSPQEQLPLLRALFSNLQNRSFYETVMNASIDEIKQLFKKNIFKES